MDVSAGGSLLGNDYPSATVAQAWDDHIGASTVFLHVGYPQEPKDYSDLWTSQGRPGDYATFELVQGIALAAKAGFESFRKFTLTQAVREGFVGVGAGLGERPIPTFFPDVQPLGSNEEYDQRLDELRRELVPNLAGLSDRRRRRFNYASFIEYSLDVATLTPDMVAQLLYASLFYFSPTSHSLFTES
jgi:hypothetical protein